MVGIKLIEQIRKEIDRYIGVPYWCNRWENNLLVKEGAFGGKGTIEEIEYATECAAEKEKLNISQLSAQEIYNLRKRNHIGIDCSGLAYHLENKLDQLKGNNGILFKVTGVDRPYGIIGVRSVSAYEITHLQNAVPVDSFENIECGDLIRIHQGKHVIFIIEKIGDTISYVHSSEKTKERGVHYGQIHITKPDKTLNHQQWTDITLEGTNYNLLFDPEKGDGIYRLKCCL